MSLTAPTAVADRRKQERSPLCTAVTVLLPGDDVEEDGSASFLMIRGWSRNISREGISFVCDQQVMAGHVFLLVKLPDRGNCFYEAQVFNARQVEEGQWEHSALFRRLLSTT